MYIDENTFITQEENEPRRVVTKVQSGYINFIIVNGDKCYISTNTKNNKVERDCFGNVQFRI